MVIYCDSVILIYYFEGDPSFKARATARLSALAATGDQIAVSDLSRLECRLKPLRVGAPATLALYDGLFARPDVRIVPITSAVFDRATLIRARLNFKLADSLHLAAAVEARCDRFLTNDTRLSAFTDIPVDVLP
jgi:predicted nucleic acid-binding protein